MKGWTIEVEGHAKWWQLGAPYTDVGQAVRVMRLSEQYDGLAAWRVVDADGTRVVEIRPGVRGES